MFCTAGAVFVMNNVLVPGADNDMYRGLFVECVNFSVVRFYYEQKFVAIDEATVMQEIIDERDVEIKKVWQHALHFISFH